MRELLYELLEMSGGGMPALGLKNACSSSVSRKSLWCKVSRGTKREYLESRTINWRTPFRSSREDTYMYSAERRYLARMQLALVLELGWTAWDMLSQAAVLKKIENVILVKADRVGQLNERDSLRKDRITIIPSIK